MVFRVPKAADDSAGFLLQKLKLSCLVDVCMNIYIYIHMYLFIYLHIYMPMYIYIYSIPLSVPGNCRTYSNVP